MGPAAGPWAGARCGPVYRNGVLPAEKELEANAYVEGWGSVIFQTATEMMHNEKMRTLVEQIPAIRAEAGAFHGFCCIVITLLNKHSNLCIELKYGKFPLPQLVVQAPAPGSPASPSTPLTPARPTTPLSPKTNGGGLAPSSAGAESGTFSDSERSASPTSPRSPSRSVG